MTTRTRRHEAVDINGYKVGELRQKLGVSQERLAALTGEVTRGYISKIEGRAHNQVGRVIAERLATALSTRLDVLENKTSVYSSPLAIRPPRDILIRTLIQRLEDSGKHLEEAYESLHTAQELLQELLKREMEKE